MHPDMKQALPLAPEGITNRDGTERQDCEINAAKRLLVKLRKAHPKLPFIIVGDKVTYRNSWVTDISANAGNIVELVKAKSICRWCFSF